MTRWTRSVLAAVAAATATVLVTGTASAAGTPGRPSIGDPYFPNDGNTGYEVDHYNLRLTYQPGADHLAGTATILATTEHELSSFSFDFGLNASSVLVDNVPAKFTKRGNKLLVTPKHSVPGKRPVTVVVRYQGVPSTVEIDGKKVWTATPDGAHSVAQPHLASAWFPCNDHPSDKATFEVSVAVPDGTSAISTGVLADKSSRLGWTRWNWRSSKPQATYNQMLTIGKYDVRHQTLANGRPFVTAYDLRTEPSLLAAARAAVERTPEVLDFESELFGEYPFEAAGGVVDEYTGSDHDAEEFQTRPVYDAGEFLKDSNMYIVVHENAHQWFGDAVSPADWSNIWLNEGFANYSEWLWSEHEGEGTAQQLASWTYAHQDEDYWKIKPGNPGGPNLLSNPVYTRGAMTLQALRSVVGDDAFFTILRTWVRENRYGNGAVGQFTALAERVSGKNLGKFFKTWLFTSAKPAATPENGFPVQTMAAAGEPKSYAKLTAVRHPSTTR
ncbi:M1 family metallopeptidase [Amycolatopsis sp. CA-230715]|uniref:M1 family metallopeptidase n=1 Tax=Amycolatopsis sp. CA-230715 TaxID=2745196 RepID=UPI001C0191A6|nr:M1 family metallopeptidase [Amycolatopsis sp. CA-230715]QWF83636.1 hypothetical protein HUW46_07079 [Amycolatopsis sp. CA-230715]